MSNSAVRALLLILVLSAGGFAQQPAFPRGEIVPRVVALADASQSYALYLPSAYDAEKKWPVIFAHDPVARGELPVRLLRAAAERYGYIVLGSHNSRNGPLRPQIAAFEAMWNDAHRRFALDDRRAYAIGFSGGARAATLAGHLCKCLAGVIAVGAGLSDSLPPDTKPTYALYGIAGDRDFNYSELIRLRDRLDDLGLENELRIFPGPHRWAPEEEMTAAVAWLELHAMRTGRRPPDPAFIAAQWELALGRARAAEKRGDLYAAFHAYRSAARSFHALRDTSAAEQKVAALAGSAAVQKARKQEREAVEWQDRLTGRVQGLVQAITQPSDERAAQLLALRSEVSTLRPGKEDDVVRARAAAHVTALLYETGEQAARDGDLALAAQLFDIVADLVPQSAGAQYQLARVHARAGKKKDALRAFERAVELGLRGRAQIAAEADLAPLRNEPRFQQLLARIPE